MYLLMNKDNIVAAFSEKTETEFSVGVSFEMNETFGKLPYGFKNINAWLDGRKSSRYNRHLEKLMMQMGCHDNKGFIRITHAATINDTFWIKTDKERLSWEQISLYRNQFTETISRLAFEGDGLYDTVFSTVSPELACEGSFRKCFRKENETGEWGTDIFIYKRSGDGASNTGLEPYCEKMASEIACIISPDTVSYQLTHLHDKLASRCNLFTSEEYGYASFAKLADVGNMDFEQIFRYFAEHGAEQSFREMLVIDSLCFNEDRHAGNFGMLFQNDTMKILRMSPIFDLNISLLAYVNGDDLMNIGDALYACKPELGNDFTRIGQIGCNDIIRDRVKDLKDFSFSFRGDDTFSPERVQLLEDVVRKQAEAILSPEKLMTKDVFFSQIAENVDIQRQKVEEGTKRINKFMDILDTIELDDAGYSYDITFDKVQCYVENIDSMMTIDFLANETTIIHNQKKIQPDELQECDNRFYNVYLKVQDEWNIFLANEQ